MLWAVRLISPQSKMGLLLLFMKLSINALEIFMQSLPEGCVKTVITVTQPPSSPLTGKMDAEASSSVTVQVTTTSELTPQGKRIAQDGIIHVSDG